MLYYHFIECIKTRNKPNCDIEIARDVAVNAHFGNIAMRVGRKVYWDDPKNSFVNDKEANAYIKKEYRAPWKFPAVGK